MGSGQPHREAALRHVDRGLLRLRRVWAAPAGVQHRGKPIPGSTLLVCLALADLEATDDEGADIAAVMRALDVAHSTASRLVAQAVSLGMVEQRRSDHDLRHSVLTLTAAGTDLVHASREFRAARLAEALTAWTTTELSDLARLLTKLADDIGAPRPDG
jgi:DNA-binding MarR family transcriptional regulator